MTTITMTIMEEVEANNKFCQANTINAGKTCKNGFSFVQRERKRKNNKLLLTMSEFISIFH